MAEENGKDVTEEEANERTWRDSLDDVTEIFEACLEKAEGILDSFGEGGARFVKMDWLPGSTVHLAESLFSAVVTAEAGRRQAQMQQAQNVTMPLIMQRGPDGRPIQFLKPPGV